MKIEEKIPEFYFYYLPPIFLIFVIFLTYIARKIAKLSKTWCPSINHFWQLRLLYFDFFRKVTVLFYGYWNSFTNYCEFFKSYFLQNAWVEWNFQLSFRFSVKFVVDIESIVCWYWVDNRFHSFSQIVKLWLPLNAYAIIIFIRNVGNFTLNPEYKLKISFRPCISENFHLKIVIFLTFTVKKMLNFRKRDVL